MGQSIAIGDFNHDGFKDIVMGGYARSSAGPESVTRVFVFLGTGYSATSGLPLFRHRLTIEGDMTFDLFGFAVAFIGDLDGDQCDELVVGAPRFGLTDSGRVSIFFGDPGLSANPNPLPNPATILASAADLTFDGTVDEGWLGASLATAQTASGAFLKDLLIGAPGAGPVNTTSIKGSVYQIELPTMEMAGALATSVPGVIIGVSTISGGTPGITGSLETGYVLTSHRVLQGSGAGDRFGHALAFVRDLDGAAGQEFLVGAPQYQPELEGFATIGAGYVRLFRMGSGTPLVNIPGTQAGTVVPPRGGEAFGSSVGGGVQLNPDDDSTPDLLVGAPLFNQTVGASVMVKAGRVIAFSGEDAALYGLATAFLVDSPVVNGTIMLGAGAGDQFGYSVTGVPDMDANNFDEILVGAWQANGLEYCAGLPNRTAQLAGAAYLYFPGVEDPDDAAYKFYGEAGRDHMGRAVAAGELVATDPPMVPAKPEIVLSGVAWTPPVAGDEDRTEFGKGYVFVGELLPPPGP